MVTVNAALLQGQFNDAAITAANAEYVLDGAINLLNTYDAALDSLTGAAGSKTGTYTSKQTGAIMTMAQQIYSKHFKNADGSNSGNIGGIGISYSTDMQLLRFAKQLAWRLIGADFNKV